MKKLLLVLLTVSFFLFIGCGAAEEAIAAGTSSDEGVNLEDGSSTAQDDNSVADQSSAADNSVADESTADDNSVADQSSADQSSAAAVSSATADVSYDAVCGTFEGAVGSTARSEWNGEIGLNDNLAPYFLPSGVWADGAHQNASLVFSEGCLNSDGDCEIEFAEADCAAIPSWMGATFLNNNQWEIDGASFEFTTDPTKLVAEIKGVGQAKFLSMGEEKSVVLTSSYQDFTLDLSSAIIAATGEPVGLALESSAKYIIIKNIRFE